MHRTLECQLDTVTSASQAINGLFEMVLRMARRHIDFVIFLRIEIIFFHIILCNRYYFDRKSFKNNETNSFDPEYVIKSKLDCLSISVPPNSAHSTGNGSGWKVFLSNDWLDRLSGSHMQNRFIFLFLSNILVNTRGSNWSCGSASVFIGPV